jgi:hypothetical protein
VTGPRVLPYLASSSRQTASMPGPVAQEFAGLQSAEKPCSLPETAPHSGLGEGGSFDRGGLRGNRATHVQEPLGQLSVLGWEGGGWQKL